MPNGRSSRSARSPSRLRLAPGGTLPLFGAPHVIDWAPERPRRVVARGRAARRRRTGRRTGRPHPALAARRGAGVADARDRRIAAARAGIAVTSVGVGDPRSRWGSCASDGRIRYSWRLIMAPDFVRRATVAHEVAHRVHMDHSPRFHALVRELLGADPAPARAWLRREGAACTGSAARLVGLVGLDRLRLSAPARRAAGAAAAAGPAAGAARG